MGILLAIAVSLLLGVDPPAATAPADTSPAPAGPGLTVTEAQFDQMIADLRHPRFAVREAATERLCRLDAGYLPALAARYRAQDDYETKRRIRYAVEYIFHCRQIVGREGFLGISILRPALPDVTDPTTGKATCAVVVNDVKAGHAAQRGGIRAGDFVVSLNGQPIPEDRTSASFVKMISTYPPGAQLELRVLRAAEGSREVTTELAEQGKVLEGATLERLPEGAGFSVQGVRVVAVAAGSKTSALGLKPNDVLTPIELQPAAGGNEPRIPADLIGNAKRGGTLTLKVRSLIEVPLRVTLGARPPEFIDNPDDLAEAQMRFARWWGQQGGELTPPAPQTLHLGKLVQTMTPRPPVPDSAILP